MKEPTPSQKPPWPLAWSFIFMANLIVPLCFGCLVTEDGGRIGMAVGIVLLWAIGQGLTYGNVAVGRALVVGGVMVGLSQGLLVLQILAGQVSLIILEELGLRNFSDPGIKPEVGGLLATLSTGGLLMGAAACCGGLATSLFAGRSARKTVTGVPLYDRELDG